MAKKSKKPAAEAQDKAAEAEIARLQEEVQKLQDTLARTQAELANQQKRSEREREVAARYRVEPLARELLEILDAMTEAQKSMSEDQDIPETLREGQALTLRQLMQILEKFSVEAIEPEGDPFDPQSHEAVVMQPSEQCKPGHVMEVLRKGYRLHDRLLRPARVVVAKASESDEEQAPDTGSEAAT